MKACANCRHWAGSASNAYAACNSPDSYPVRTAFDSGTDCRLWEAKSDAPTTPQEARTAPLATHCTKCMAIFTHYRIWRGTGYVCVRCNTVWN